MSSVIDPFDLRFDLPKGFSIKDSCIKKCIQALFHGGGVTFPDVFLRWRGILKDFHMAVPLRNSIHLKPILDTSENIDDVLP